MKRNTWFKYDALNMNFNVYNEVSASLNLYSNTG